MDVGDTVTVLWGKHAGITGTIERVGAFIEIVVPDDEDPDWPNTYLIDPEQLRPEDIRASIAKAARLRGAYGYQLRRFWLAAVLRDPPRDDLAALAAEYAACAAPIERACEDAIAAALARWDAETAGLDADARDAKWRAERAAWTDWQDQFAAVFDAILAELRPDVPAAERRRDLDELEARSRRLEERVDAHKTVVGLAEAAAHEPRDEQLERQIEADVDRDDAFLVYADWLQSHGNRRGEWIALSAAAAATDQLRKELAPQLLGPLIELEYRLAARWRLGYLDAITLETTRGDEAAGLNVVDLVTRALALPTCRFLRELTIGLPSVHEKCSVIDALVAAGPRPALRRLALTTNTEEEMLSWTVAGDLTPVVELYPNLVSLEVEAGSYSLSIAGLSRLQRLVLKTCYPPAGIALAIARTDWPHLEELELWFGSSYYDVELSIDEVVPLLEAPLPKLRRLGLCNCEVTDELCERLVASPLLPRLERLSLAKATLSDAGAQVILDNADRFRHLVELDVDNNYLDDGDLERLRAAGLPIISTWQRTLDPGEEERYAAVGE